LPVIRRFLAAALLGGAALIAVASALPAAHAVRTLNATVGPGATISLKHNGSRVRTLSAGTYRFVVSDRAAVHNFVLEKSHGGAFEKTLTGVAFKGTRTVQVRLTAGEWEFYCRPHEDTMHGDFTVT
jgi:plastocyanin